MSEAKQGGLGAELPAGTAPLALVFAIGSRLFGLPLGSVREVIRVPPITPIPRGPANVVGVSLAGGAVITMFDLARPLGLARSAQSEHGRVLLVRQPGEVVGLVVDRVLGVRDLAAGDEAVDGAAARPVDSPLLLDPDALFSSD
jgi:purine-binding chemotaxis protein CheW